LDGILDGIGDFGRTENEILDSMFVQSLLILLAQGIMVRSFGIKPRLKPKVCATKPSQQGLTSLSVMLLYCV